VPHISLVFREMWDATDVNLKRHRCRDAYRPHKGNAEALAAEIRAIADRSAAHVKSPHLDRAQYLYDEHGLPK
jgi:hypothetical protein